MTNIACIDVLKQFFERTRLYTYIRIQPFSPIPVYASWLPKLGTTTVLFFRFLVKRGRLLVKFHSKGMKKWRTRNGRQSDGTTEREGKILKEPNT